MHDVAVSYWFLKARWPVAFCLAIASILLGKFGPALADDDGSARASRPNIIFIMADDLGYGDLGCYGATDIRTPQLDRLAAEGVLLTDCYSNGSVCSPTRAAFMTGRYQQRIGLEWAVYYNVPREGLPSAETSLAASMRQAGYVTAMSGKWHLGYDSDMRPLQHGFEYFFGLLGGNVHYFEHYDRQQQHDLYVGNAPVDHSGRYITDLITDYAIEFVEAAGDQPFFLYVPYNAPHFPYQAPADAQRDVSGSGWQSGTRADQYAPMVESIDTNVGRLRAALARLGKADNTLIVFTSDNGGMNLSRMDPLRGQKGTLWEGGIRAPGIACWPAAIPAGTRSNQVVLTMDWSATFTALAGAQPRDDRPLDGINVIDVLTGRSPSQERTVFWRRSPDPYRKGVNRQWAVRAGDWKYLRDATDGEHLFNLKDDIGESHNLAAEESQRLTALRQLVQQWEDDIDPPLYDQWPADKPRPKPIATSTSNAGE